MKINKTDILAIIFCTLLAAALLWHAQYLGENNQELQKQGPAAEVVQKDTTKPKSPRVGDSYKGEIKHLRDGQGRTRCFYSYVNRYGQHKRIFILGCHKHKK